MKKTYSIIALCILTGCTNVSTLRPINGVTLTKVTTRGVFSPSTSTLIASDPHRKGEISVLTSASGPGVLPAIATAGGLVGAAAVLRPARSENVSNNSGGNGSSSASAYSSSAAVGNGAVVPQFVPPGHINNPSQNH